MRVLILTRAQDEHAAYIRAGLVNRGIEVDCWFTSDFPSRQSQTVSFGIQPSLKITTDLSEYDLRDYTMAWYRRPNAPNANYAVIDRRDREYVHRAGMLYQGGLDLLLSKPFGMGSPVWINAPRAAQAAEMKVYQLAVAQDCGWRIPETIISNDVHAIKAFLNTRGGTAVHKTLGFYSWTDDGYLAPTRSSRITEADLGNGSAPMHSPEIFQEEILKKVEIRAFFFGPNYFALRFFPREKANDRIDWRDYHAPDRSIYETFTLPEDIEKRCRDMLNRLGLISGSFDLLVDKNDRYIFAELNQAGQFVWLEDFGIPVIDGFCRFLGSGDANFQVDKSLLTLSKSEIERSAPFHELLEQESFRYRPPGLDGEVRRDALASFIGGRYG